MLRNYQRPIASLLGAVMLLATVGPSILEAQVLKRVALRASMDVHKTADIFDAKGRLISHFDNPNSKGAAVAIIRAWRANKDSLENFRKAVLKYAKSSRRGAAGTTVMMQLIDVLEAKTDAEYHAKVRQLPVEVRKTAGHDALGRAGTQTEFVVRGKVRVRLFALPDAASQTTRPAIESSDVESLEPSADFETVSSPSPTTVNAVDDCYYEGEPAVCATEEEKEDATIYAATIDAEVDAINVDVDTEATDLENYCTIEVICLPGSDAAVGGPHVAEPAAKELPMPCFDEYTNFVGAVLSTHGAGLLLLAAVAIPATPALVVAGSALVLAGCFVWAVSGGSSYINCAKRVKGQ